MACQEEIFKILRDPAIQPGFGVFEAGVRAHLLKQYSEEEVNRALDAVLTQGLAFRPKPGILQLAPGNHI